MNKFRPKANTKQIGTLPSKALGNKGGILGQGVLKALAFSA
jgi:hypothetical protein